MLNHAGFIGLAASFESGNITAMPPGIEIANGILDALAVFLISVYSITGADGYAVRCTKFMHF